jgi:hypothetical protein
MVIAEPADVLDRVRGWAASNEILVETVCDPAAACVNFIRARCRRVGRAAKRVPAVAPWGTSQPRVGSEEHNVRDGTEYKRDADQYGVSKMRTLSGRGDG